MEVKEGVDLLPIQNLGTCCSRDKERALVVNVRNGGTVTSPETTPRVTFAQVSDVTLPTPAIAPSGVVQHHVAIPAECFHEGGGNCTVVIEADAYLDVTELSEQNNEVTETCPGSRL